ncbi:MAG TPA: HAD-IA family hydrolase, partial [Bacteroidales bacterium]|nr:HAD-IA family hydrolase [Bacteroidales bacterium]
HSDEEKEKLATKKNNWYRELILKMTPGDLLPGAKEFLQELKSEGYKIAIGSSSKNAATILERIGYLDYFDAIVDGNKIKNSKPDPEVFLKAAAELGIKPENCVVFEDAQAGIEAAIRAGMKTIGVGSPETLSEADVVIPNLKEAGIAIFSKLI